MGEGGLAANTVSIVLFDFDRSAERQELDLREGRHDVCRLTLAVLDPRLLDEEA